MIVCCDCLLWLFVEIVDKKIWEMVKCRFWLYRASMPLSKAWASLTLKGGSDSWKVQPAVDFFLSICQTERMERHPFSSMMFQLNMMISMPLEKNSTRFPPPLLQVLQTRVVKGPAREKRKTRHGKQEKPLVQEIPAATRSHISHLVRLSIWIQSPLCSSAASHKPTCSDYWTDWLLFHLSACETGIPGTISINKLGDTKRPLAHIAWNCMSTCSDGRQFARMKKRHVGSRDFRKKMKSCNFLNQMLVFSKLRSEKSIDLFPHDLSIVDSIFSKGRPDLIQFDSFLASAHRCDAKLFSKGRCRHQKSNLWETNLQSSQVGKKKVCIHVTCENQTAKGFAGALRRLMRQRLHISRIWWGRDSRDCERFLTTRRCKSGLTRSSSSC